MKNGADPDPKAVISDPKAVIPDPIYVATTLLFSCFVQVKTLNLLYNDTKGKTKCIQVVVVVVDGLQSPIFRNWRSSRSSTLRY